MMVNPIPRLNANNTVFNSTNTSDSLLESGNLNNSTSKKSVPVQDSQKGATDPNIKNTLSILA